jgi:hypothetical protein
MGAASSRLGVSDSVTETFAAGAGLTGCGDRSQPLTKKIMVVTAVASGTADSLRSSVFALY